MTSYGNNKSAQQRIQDFDRQLANPVLIQQGIGRKCEVDDEAWIPGKDKPGRLTAQQLWDEPGQPTITWMRRAKSQLDTLHSAFPMLSFSYFNVPATRGVWRRGSAIEQEIANRITACTLQFDDGRSLVDACGHLQPGAYISGLRASRPQDWPGIHEAYAWVLAELALLGKDIFVVTSPYTHASFNPVPEPLFSDHLANLLGHSNVTVNVWTKQKSWEPSDRVWYDKYVALNQ